MQEAGGKATGGTLLRTGRSFTFMHGDLLRRPKHGYASSFAAMLSQMRRYINIHKSLMSWGQNSMHLSKAQNNGCI